MFRKSFLFLLLIAFFLSAHSQSRGNKFHINLNETFIHSKQINKNTLVSVEIPVVNDNPTTTNSDAYTHITTRDGKKIADSKPTNIAISSFSKTIAKQNMNITNPHLWLLNAALSSVKEVNPSIITLLHIALGGQNSESEFFLDNMINRGVSFDAIGESYYPKWHGTLNDLDTNLRLLQKKYNKPVIVAEYSQLKRQVNRIAFSLPGNQMKGTFIWEPLNTWESIFDKDGKSNKYLYEYDDIKNEFLKNQN